jgi:hypothetical protein
VSDETHTGLFVTDAELIRRLGVPEKTARAAIRELERRPGFPRKDPLFGDRRFWPAVAAYLENRYGLGTLAPSPPDGTENFDALRNSTRKTSGSRRTWLRMESTN